MITKAILPPRKGYVERINPNTGEHYYHKIYTKVGTIHRRIVIDNSQILKLSSLPSQFLTVTIIGGGGLSIANNDGNNSVVSKKDIFVTTPNINITIGGPGEPSAFGSFLMSNAGISGDSYSTNSKGLTVDGITYGLGETPDHPATQGVCIIEYDEPIYE